MKRSLGRGLDSLIPRGPAKENETAGSASLLEIDLTEIIPNDNQPRKVFDNDLLGELAESIKIKGVIQPIIVTKSSSGKYMIIEGERRWRASGLAGKKSVPAVLKNADTPKERLELALITNAQREDLNPVELASAYAKLIEDYGYCQEDIGLIMGKSRSAVANRLRLLTLPEEVLSALERKLITEGHARAILALENQSAMTGLLKIIIDKGLSVRETEKAVKKPAFEEKKSAFPRQKREAHFKDIINDIESFFKTKVNIKMGRKGGVIEIKYNSDDELDTIIKKIRGEIC